MRTWKLGVTSQRFVAPCVSDRCGSLQDHVLLCLAVQVITDGKTCPAATDDIALNSLGHVSASLNVNPIQQNECQCACAHDDPKGKALKKRTKTDAL